jgi:hypothetical protein
MTLELLKGMCDFSTFRCQASWQEYAFLADDAAPARPRQPTFGLFPAAALLNHSCHPGVCKVLLEDWVILRAARDLRPGEEACHYYCDLRMPVAMRQRELGQEYGFSCGCARCAMEEHVAASLAPAALHPYTRVYSCRVASDDRFAAAEAALAEMSRAAGLMSTGGGGVVSGNAKKTLGSLKDESAQATLHARWLDWPLVPALVQLAESLGYQHRNADAQALWQRAETAFGAVLPLSNLHLHAAGKALEARAQQQGDFGGDAAVQWEAGLVRAVAASRRLVAQGFGDDADGTVWRKLVGDGLPAAVVQLAMALEVDEAGCPTGCSVEGAAGAQAAAKVQEAFLRNPVAAAAMMAEGPMPRPVAQSMFAAGVQEGDGVFELD